MGFLMSLAVSIILAFVAAFGAWVAACQMWIARERLRLDAFDRVYNRRVAIYEATRAFLEAVFDGEKISKDDIKEYGRKALDARFLFDDNLQKFLSDVRDHVAAWQDANSHAESEQAGEEKSEYLRLANKHIRWITEQGDQRFPLRFAPFLIYRPAKHPWFLRWLPELAA